MRHFGKISSLLVVLCLLLTACVMPTGQPAESAAPAAADSGEKITLNYWTHQHAPSIPINEEIIKEFQEAHPNVEIVFDHAPHDSYEQKVLTAFAGGQGPDVFWMGDWMVPQLIKNDMVAEVDPTAFGVQTPEEFVKLFAPGSLDAFTVDGKIYTGGISEYNSFSLIYNVDHFKEAGIDPLPTDKPITWEELAAIGQKLTTLDGDKVTRVGLNWPFTSGIWTVLILEPMLRQLGGEVISAEGQPQFDAEPMAAVMNYVSELAKNKVVDPAIAPALLDDFAAGRASMIFGSPWAVSPLKDLNKDLNWAIAPLPQFSNAQSQVTTLYAWAWFVNKNSSPEKQKLAWEFVNLLTSKQTVWWDKVGYVQARLGQTEVGEDITAYRAKSDDRLKIIFDDYQYGKFQFRSTAYFELSDLWTRALTRVLAGEDVAAVLNETQELALKAGQ